MIENIIKDDFNRYRKAYTEIQNSNNLRDESKLLFVRSLYLAIYTDFEYFLNKLTDTFAQYLYDGGTTYTDLPEWMARKKFIEDEKMIRTVIDTKSEQKFQEYFNKIREPITFEKLSSFLKIDRFNKRKMKSAFRNIFSAIFGKSEETYMEKSHVRIRDTIEGIDSSEELSYLEFIQNFAEVRNSIAHENRDLTFDMQYTFEQVLDGFSEIIKKIRLKYFEKYNKDILSVPEPENILADDSPDEEI